MKLLNEKYGIVESDFLSAELEVVPAKIDDVELDKNGLLKKRKKVLKKY